VIWPSSLFYWETYPDVPYNNSSIYEMYEIVTTAWRVLRLRVEERPPIRRVAANKLNKHSRTADEVWSSSLGFGHGAKNTSLLKLILRNTHMRDDSSGDKTIRR